VKVVGAPGKENLKAQVVAPEEKKE
jgi:hypothetical protein